MSELVPQITIQFRDLLEAVRDIKVTQKKNKVEEDVQDATN